MQSHCLLFYKKTAIGALSSTAASILHKESVESGPPEFSAGGGFAVIHPLDAVTECFLYVANI
jgi:hypothetical protein